MQQIDYLAGNADPYAQQKAARGAGRGG